MTESIKQRRDRLSHEHAEPYIKPTNHHVVVAFECGFDDGLQDPVVKALVATLERYAGRPFIDGPAVAALEAYERAVKEIAE